MPPLAERLNPGIRQFHSSRYRGRQDVHHRGVTASPGLYFLGTPWQHTRSSALLGWVKDDAQHRRPDRHLASTGTRPVAPALAADPPQR